MAKLAVTIAVLFLLLAFSPAHFQEVDLPEHDAAATVATKASLSEIQKAIFLPSEDVGFNPQDAESKSGVFEVETDPDTHTVLLIKISFRPNSRQFPRRPMLPFHHRHRLNCSQGSQFRRWDPKFQKKNAIPFGDNMIRSSSFRGPRHFPVEEENERKGRDEAIFRGPRHFHGEEEHERKRHEHHDHPHEHHRHEEEEGGFLKNFRKFLNHKF